MKLYVDSKVMNQRYDVSELISSVNVSLPMSGSAGKLDFTLVKDAIAVFHEGDCIEFYDEDIPVFKGYVFTKTANEKKEIKTTCYDQLRYLKAKDSFQFQGETLNVIVITIANQFQLQVGEIEDIEYQAVEHYHEDESLLDIITYHVQQAMLKTQKRLVFYDDFGKLSLRSAENMLTRYVLGFESLMGSYSYKSDIDSSTYNYIKLVKPNKTTGKGDVYAKTDPATIKRWGRLQYYEVLDENLNEAQIIEYLNLLFKSLDRVHRTLSIEALGIPGLRGGNTVYIDIPEIGDINIGKYLLVDSVTHKYKGSEHTMSLELEVL